MGMVRLLAVMLVLAGMAMGQDVTTLKLGTSLVLVPAMVRTKAGEPVFTLQAKDFIVTDDGVEQKVRMEDDNGAEPLALVVVLEAGDTPENKFGDYGALKIMLDAVVGGAEHQVAVVGFDSEAAVVQPWTPDLDVTEDALARIETGDGGAASLDAIEMAVGMLQTQPLKYRRAILLVSETVDRGSHAKMYDALRAVSDGNTVIYSLGYSSTRATVFHGGDSGEPPPPHGCMGKAATEDLEGNAVAPPGNTKAQGSHANSKTLQAYDCLALLAPPLALAKAAVLAAMNGFRANVPQTAAKISGGEYFKVENGKAMVKDLQKIANRLPNRYYLSFTPSATHPGLHAIGVKLREPREGVVVEARTGYWEDGK